MTTSFETVLSALCSRVEAVNSAHDHVYMLGDAKEAKLAYDVLLAHGFDVKLYSEPNGSKLYITRPGLDDAALAARLQPALVYANTLKGMKQSVDALSQSQTAGVRDYTVAFANTPTGKQITIHMSGPVAAPAPAAARPAAQAQSARPQAQVHGRKKHGKGKKESNEMFAKSELAKTYPFAKNSASGAEEHTFSNMMSRIFVQNIASNGTIILTMVFVGCLIITLAITSLGFLCPDLAYDTHANTAWYCKATKPPKEGKKNVIQ